ncbi:unnamed protein product [Microthlaspi erraticum]|uniref:Uncharacterized protein n=1 Tax=Microthlaspi erraticum TaxID=1685480 RepID=A0A6D2JVV7_9BRAS|nr:unnamed protein product [Microthlaspi erraticum]
MANKKFCKYHKRYGHSTEECQNPYYVPKPRRNDENNQEPSQEEDVDEHYRQLLTLKNLLLKTSKKEIETRTRKTLPLPALKQQIDMIFREFEHCGGSMKSFDTPPHLHPKKTLCLRLRELRRCKGGVEAYAPKRINFISGGSEFCRNSVNSTKAFQRKASSSSNNLRTLNEPDTEIAFLESETLNLDKPHDDALVV